MVHLVIELVRALTGRSQLTLTLASGYSFLPPAVRAFLNNVAVKFSHMRTMVCVRVHKRPDVIHLLEADASVILGYRHLVPTLNHFRQDRGVPLRPSPEVEAINRGHLAV